MGHQLKLILIAALLAMFSSSFVLAASDTSQVKAVPADELRDLASHQQWLHLLHYRQHPYTFRFISQNDSPEFFLAEKGKTNAHEELVADLSAFLLTDQADNASAQCRFPARYHWLKHRLPQVGFVDQPCSEFDEWRDELNAHRLTLIFPASHINSPSSMYGHTLVRMDREDPSSSKLLAYSVNFAANADPTDNELVFSYKGLSGGYPGEVSVMPYYVKTNQYQHMEYRDTWEYELDFGSAEVDQFVRHVWELQDTAFDYFFFDENCSYRLLTMLDAASSRSDLAADFKMKAVPVDTIRALYSAGFVSREVYRPSAASVMESNAALASEQEADLARTLVESDIPIGDLLAGVPEESQTRVLELAYSYARYLSVKKKQANPVLRKRTLQVLSARSKLPAGDVFPAPRKPEFRDDEGHGTARLSVGGGYTGEQWHGDINWRIAYHDVLDPSKGFSPGAQIEMGDFYTRVTEDGDVRLQKLTLVNVLSLSHKTRFQNPVAWTVSAGLDRFNHEGSELYSRFNLGFGRAWQLPLGLRDGKRLGSARLFALGDLTARADNQFDDGYQISAGVRAGWLWQGRLNQEMIQFRWQPAALGDDTPRRELTVEEAFNGFDNVQLRFGFSRQWASSEATNSWKLTYAWYF